MQFSKVITSRIQREKLSNSIEHQENLKTKRKINNSRIPVPQKPPKIEKKKNAYNRKKEKKIEKNLTDDSV